MPVANAELFLITTEEGGDGVEDFLLILKGGMDLFEGVEDEDAMPAGAHFFAKSGFHAGQVGVHFLIELGQYILEVELGPDEIAEGWVAGNRGAQ